MLGNIRIVFPPLPEQTQIAAFLDHETAKIDALIAKQERLIELLEEKRQAVISHTVTKGLNPDAPLRPSGVNWLGDIPEHWQVVQSRRLFAQRTERAHPEDKQLTASQKYGVIFQADFMEREGKRVVQVIKGADTVIFFSWFAGKPLPDNGCTASRLKSSLNLALPMMASLPHFWGRRCLQI